MSVSHPTARDAPGQDVHASTVTPTILVPVSQERHPTLCTGSRESFHKDIPARKSKVKSLSSGWKTIAWTKPAAETLSTIPATVKQPKPIVSWTPTSRLQPQIVNTIYAPSTSHQARDSPAPNASRQTLTRGCLADNHQYAAEEMLQNGETADSNAVTPRIGTFVPNENTTRASPTQTTKNSVQDGSAPLDSVRLTEPRQHANDNHPQLTGFPVREKGKDLASKWLGMKHRGTATLDALDNTRKPCATRTRPIEPEERDVQLERSASDTSVVTASDFGLGNPHAPTIVADISDSDAIKGLESLCAAGKGLPLVKYAAMGGGKSRKYLKYVPEDKVLLFCGTRRPYFKTKVLTRDIERAGAKWCCVVVCAKGRSPLRLETDSIETAEKLKAGLMAVSRVDSAMSVSNTDTLQVSNQRDGSGEEDIELSIVRPGHEASAVYDPEAALSVAALLAKEMEEERGTSSAALSSLTNKPPTKPIGSRNEMGKTIKRSASMTSVESSKPAGHVACTDFTRNSVSRCSRTAMNNLDADFLSSLERLSAATEGRGLMVSKKKEGGKRSSRVLVRFRKEAKTISWTHVLPPFTKKTVPVKDVIGATRSVCVVTLVVFNREPILFETDRLTDAILLEKGFACVSALSDDRVS